MLVGTLYKFPEIVKRKSVVGKREYYTIDPKKKIVNKDLNLYLLTKITKSGHHILFCVKTKLEYKVDFCTMEDIIEYCVNNNIEYNFN